MTFDEFFKKATGNDPFPFQGRFAQEPILPQLVHVPTGLGKTAMAVVGWLWRRFAADHKRKSTTPRRLVYCLPMRVLVEQTRDNAVFWLHNLDLLAGKAEFVDQDGGKRLRSYTPDLGSPEKITVHILMGGEGEEDWDIYPEREAIIIGTQDMLLSRALNRGYAASRARWPMQFGLLHTDCLWVFDEIQLMGSGLATTAQLEAFRHLFGSQDGHRCHSVWMSATMQPDWLQTVDFRDRVKDLQSLRLDDDDHNNAFVRQRWTAQKPLQEAAAKMGDTAALASEIRQAHKSGTRTIVVVNTVKRARELYKALNSASSRATASAKKGRRNTKAPATAESGQAGVSTPRIVLLHSRFRPGDRNARFAEAMADPPDGGTIIVSTQVIEAGVDISATTLFTELAPWPSLVQRFGRCNRRGEENGRASVWWIGLPAAKAGSQKDDAPYPYELDDLNRAAMKLRELHDVGLESLPEVPLSCEYAHVIRRRDLIDLFDTTPDLAGNDMDIDRFVREVEDSDVRVFWRDYGDPKKGATPNRIGGRDADDKESRVAPAPTREELCSAPVGDFRDFVKKKESDGLVWRWDFLDKMWKKVDPAKIAPGQVFLVHADAGGYSAERGWEDLSGKTRVEPVAPPGDATNEAPDATDDDRLSHVRMWQTIAEHADAVCREMNAILTDLLRDDVQRTVLLRAACWHDRGKAHEIFRKALPSGSPDAEKVWAKAAGPLKPYERPHFRHELASALAVLSASEDLIPSDQRDLVAYLVAAHHGKVRLSIRSLPNEPRPSPRADASGRERLFARGVWDGDELPETDLGQGCDGRRIIAPRVPLSLEPMKIGLCEQPPFAGQPSWAERMTRLRDTLGPFRLAYLEAILRAADIRASITAGRSAAGDQPAANVPDIMEADHG